MPIGKKQFEDFAQFFEEPVRYKLKEIITRTIGETDYLDFKEEWPEHSKLASHILAFGNSGGGALVIGVKETASGDLESKGINRLEDKTEVAKGVQKFVPQTFQEHWSIFDFNYKDDAPENLQGKKFQVVLVENDPTQIPLISAKDGKNIESNKIYVRRSTSTDIATHQDIKSIIDRRLSADRTNDGSLTLSGHLNQLKTLYKEVVSEPFLFGGFSAAKLLTGQDPMESYRNFVKNRIEKKQNRIDQILDL